MMKEGRSPIPLRPPNQTSFAMGPGIALGCTRSQWVCIELAMDLQWQMSEGGEAQGREGEAAAEVGGEVEEGRGQDGDDRKGQG